MIVMMTAMTPSENASTRALENDPSELDIWMAHSYASVRTDATESFHPREVAESRSTSLLGVS
jgi:hypothetical protein